MQYVLLTITDKKGFITGVDWLINVGEPKEPFVLKYKGEPVYIDKNEIKIDGILNEELIDMDVYNEDSFIGKVTDILNNGVYDILVIEKENNKNLVPNINEFIKNIDLENKKIQINMIEGLINEN